jgi:putative transposase
MLKRGLHSPAHLFVDNAAYFITSSIYQKRPLLKPEPIKHHLLATIEAYFHEKTGSWIIGLF